MLKVLFCFTLKIYCISRESKFVPSTFWLSTQRFITCSSLLLIVVDSDFAFTEDDAGAILDAYDDKTEIWNNGIDVANVKYFTLRVKDGYIYGKKVRIY